MEIIGQKKLYSFSPGANGVAAVECSAVRLQAGVIVESYLELARKIAELQYKNPDFVLLFRGQARDYLNRESYSSIKPTLFRSQGGANPDPGELLSRFNRLRSAEFQLVNQYEIEDLPGITKLKRQPILRWSILQHYEVCATPLLDVTHSLRIAASFASEGADGDAFLFVLGVPNLSGAVTASAEAGIQIVRLASVCPPTALRPHIQEGYLLGEYPDMVGYDQKQHYPAHEIDFGRRLVAKFKFNPETFWADPAFPRIDRGALYPNQLDPLFRITQPIKQNLN